MSTAVPGPEERSSRVNLPRQRRSHETYERILERAETLLDGRDFETVTILEILEVAEVSASSLYARFSDKQALLRALHERHFDRIRELGEALRDRPDWDRFGLEELCGTLIRIAVVHRRTNAERIRTFRQAEQRYADMEARRHRTDTWLLGMVGDYFDRRLAGVGRSLDRRDFALACYLLVCSIDAAHAAPSGFGASLEPPDDDWLAARLTKMMSLFLDLADVPPIAADGHPPPVSENP